MAWPRSGTPCKRALTSTRLSVFGLLLSAVPDLARYDFHGVPKALVSRHIEQFLDDAVERRLIDVLADYSHYLAGVIGFHLFTTRPEQVLRSA